MELGEIPTHHTSDRRVPQERQTSRLVASRWRIDDPFSSILGPSLDDTTASG